METNEINNLLFKECNLNKNEDIFTRKLRNGSFTIIKKSEESEFLIQRFCALDNWSQTKKNKKTKNKKIKVVQTNV